MGRERQPRDWLARPREFGRQEAPEAHSEPADSFERADWRAAQFQSRLAWQLWTRIQALPGSRTFSAVAEHELFPYGYDTLIKALRGQQWMALRIYAAILNSIEALEKGA